MTMFAPMVFTRSLRKQRLSATGGHWTSALGKCGAHDRTASETGWRARRRCRKNR